MSIFTAIIMLLTFNYWDGQTLMVWSVSNWDILFEGRVADFYTEKIINTRGAIQLGGCSFSIDAHSANDMEFSNLDNTLF